MVIVVLKHKANYYNFVEYKKKMMSSSTQVHREALQRQTQQDWANREYIELISGSIKVRYSFPVSNVLYFFIIFFRLVSSKSNFCLYLQRISDFLNSFDMSCRSRLSNLNEKLTEIERKVDYLEAKVARSGETPA